MKLRPQEAAFTAHTESGALQQVFGPANDRHLRITQVQQLTTYSKSSIYALMQRGEFPQSIKLSSRRTVWRESDIQAWIRGEFEAVPVAPVLSIFGGEVRS